MSTPTKYAILEWFYQNHKGRQKEVLRMAQGNYIKDLYEKEGLSLRKIAEKMHMDFRTVKKYACREDWNPPVKIKMTPENYPVLGAYISIIDEWLRQDAREPRKQRHTVSRIFRRLQKEHGYEGSYGSVKLYATRRKDAMKKERESFLPLAHPPGNAQVDFGVFKYYDSLGKERKGYALIVSFPNSNAGWMQAFQSENQECLLTGMKRIFYHIGGVPIRVRCDNMSTAVAQVLKGTERVITDGFKRFMLHHRFGADFCNPASGNEKGNVEAKVGYTRRNMLVPVPTIDDFEAFNEELFRLCDADHEREHYQKGEKIRELWNAEREHFLTLPTYEYEVFRSASLSVNKYGFITVDTVKYGLSPEMRSKIVEAKIYFDKIEASYDHQLMKTFRRSYEKNSEVYDWREYLGTMSRKPGAVPHTRFFDQMPKLWQAHLASSDSHGRKTALKVLMEIIADGNEVLSDEALELAIESGRSDADSIRQCYYIISRPESHPRPLKLSSAPPVLNYQPDLSVYDSLTGGVEL
jgi:transposase